MKYEGILTEDNADMVSMLGVINLPEAQKINLIETIAHIVYTHEERFNKLSEKEKIESLTLVTLVFDTLLDAEINPLARKHTLKALNCFNNCIYSTVAGGMQDV
jgi:hypothetical protein